MKKSKQLLLAMAVVSALSSTTAYGEELPAYDLEPTVETPADSEGESSIGEILNLPPLNAASPDFAWTEYNDEGSINIDDNTVNIAADGDHTAEPGDSKTQRGKTVTGILANKNDGSISIYGGDLNITAIATEENGLLAYGINSKDAENYNINAENVNITVTTDTTRATGINIFDKNNTETRYLTLTEVNNLTKINVKARNQAIGIYAAGNTEIDVSNVDMTKENGWGVDVEKNKGIFSSHGIYAGSSYGTPQEGGTVKVSRGLKITSRGNGIMANGGGSNVLVENSVNPIYIEVSKEKGKTNYAIIAESGLVAVNTSPSGKLLAKENTGSVTIKGNLLLDKSSAYPTEPEKNNTIILGLNNAQSSLTGLSLENFDESLLDGTSDQGTYILNTNIQLMNGATWNNENYGYGDGSKSLPKDMKSYVTNLFGGSSKEKAGIINNNYEKDTFIEKYSGNIFVNYKHVSSDPTKILGGGITVKSAEANSFMGLRTDNGGIDTSDAKSELVRNVLSNLAGKLTYQGAINKAENNLSGTVGIAEGLTASSATVKVEDVIKFNETTGVGELNKEVTPGGQDQPEPPQPEPPQPVPEPEPEPEPEPSTPEVPAGEVLNLPPLNAANPDAAWAKYKSDDSYSVNEHPVNITANNDNTVVKETVTAIAANVSDGELYVGDGDLNIVATSTDNTLVTAINDETVNNFSITAPNVNIKASANAKRDRVEGIHVKDATSKEDITSLDLSAVDNVTKIKVEARSKAYGVYTIGNTDVELSNVDMAGDSSDDWGVAVKGNTGDFGYYAAAGLYAGSNYAPGNNKGGLIKVSNGLKIRSQGTGIMANGAGATVNVYNSPENPINIEVSQEKGKMNYALLAQAGHIAINVNPSGQLVGGENVAPVTIKGNVFLANGSVNDNEPEKNTSIAVGLNNDQSSLTGLIIDNFRDDQLKTNSITAILQLQNGATWNNENYGYDGKISGVKSRLANLIGGKDKAKAGIINQNSDLDVTIDNYSGNTFVNYKHDGSDPTKILGGGITVKSAEANSFMGLRTDNGDIDTSDVKSAVVRNVLTNLAGKLTYQGAIGNKENNLNGTVGIAEGLTASAATVKVEDVIKFNETTGVGELNQVAPPPAPPEEEHPPVSPTPGEEQPPVQPPTGEQNPPVEPPTGETTPPATGGDSGTSTTPPTTGGESGSQDQPAPPTTGEGSGSQEQPVSPTTGEGSGSQEQPVQPPAGEQPGTQPGGQPQQPPVVPSKPMAPPNINLGNYETAVMKSIRASQSVSVLALREMANDVTKRLGDLHFNQGDAGLWAKVESDKHNYNKRNVYGEYDGKAIHVGYDKKVNGNWLVGGQFTHLTGDTKYSDGKGDSSLNTIGLYGTKVNENGSYVDIITKFGKLRNDYKVNTKEFNLAGKAKQNVQSFSVETGRRFTKDNGSFFEPQAELIYSHLPQADYYLTDGEHTLAVKQGSLDSLVARLGLVVGRKTDTSSIQAKLSIHNELLGTTSTVFKGENTKTVKYDYSGTWFTLGLAGTKQVSKGANIYGEITKAFGGGYSKAWNINLGARWMF